MSRGTRAIRKLRVLTERITSDVKMEHLWDVAKMHNQNEREGYRKGLPGGRKSFELKPTPFSKIQTYIGLECQRNASSLHLPPQSVSHHWSGATAAKLECLPKHSVPIYVWIFENGAHVRTANLTVFQEITEDFSFNQPQTVCQHTAYSPTSLVSYWLASSH